MHEPLPMPSNPEVVAPAPSGGTAITAGVLALFGGIASVVAGVLAIVVFAAHGDDKTFQRNLIELGGSHITPSLAVVVGCISVLVGAVLFVGAIMLCQRSMVGRWMVVGSCVVVVIGDVAVAGIEVQPPSYGLVFPIITLILAMVPATSKWLNGT
ncbi:hypothetical protein NN3_46320 [Nocardia neocaledoniensis NBRC 108232]|uniref:Uncharacterized protein n=1 Tax=Nocardia neocaledoniensis TaxID=236511 RepID=A0A317NMA3_9NOCA|nr:hypothetical protein [Nocardia neocaledoniensis]PWV76360.1 hypothetical protein DFR69_104466 [Nocardia neocaledoniensis]GEM33625.1 hypothetical protein NN3_46320 [Nocardia neocaledoniensis NBRC 108232]